MVPEIVDAGNSLVLTKILPSGAIVKPGDAVAEFDRTKLIDQARDANAKYQDLQHQVEQKKRSIAPTTSGALPSCSRRKRTSPRRSSNSAKVRFLVRSTG